jgi:ketosteroid isomerase-like protein
MTLSLAHPAPLLILIALCSAAQSVSGSARQGIDAGNRIWIDGMKKGDAKRIAATYAEDAVDCSLTGECLKGRAAIERQLLDRVNKLGPAISALVTSTGSVQQGDFVYEWGRAEASFAKGSRIVGNYLTVWRKRDGGGWEIFRNIRIPPSGSH